MAGRAFIPAASRGVAGLWRVNGELLRMAFAQHPVAQATLDMDATLIETQKREALYCYKHFKAYQPLNTWWAEQGLIVHSEFRDGNVPAGLGLPGLHGGAEGIRGLRLLPPAVKYSGERQGLGRDCLGGLRWAGGFHSGCRSGLLSVL